MSALSVGSVLLGVVVLVVGAELLVKGSAAVAGRLGVQPVVIGLTVVAFGTSAPELAVSVSSAISGEGDLAVGNVVGSNIANTLLILGASALIGTLVVSQRIVRLDAPLVVLASVVVFSMAVDRRIGRLDGVLLAAGAVLYTGWLVRSSRRESEEVAAEYAGSIDEVEGAAADRPLAWQLGLVAVGLAALVGGSSLLVGGATDIAADLGVSELVIGLTVVAVGTSLPELATSMLAAFRGERDIAVGNVVGSNLFNLLLVLGVTGAVAPGGVRVTDDALRLDLPVMLLSAIVLVPIVWNGFRIARWEGAVLIGSYLAYATYLVLDAADHRAAPMLGIAALVSVPFAVMAFGVAGWQGWRRHRAA